jgi:RNA polymerase sigma factor (sigma-70 family)
MAAVPSLRTPLAGSFSEDELLLRHCMLGDESAWSALVRKYANLIFSIPIRRGFSQEDAGDIFQSVFAALLNSMGNIREPAALAAWLIRTTAHACDKMQQRQHRWTSLETVLHRGTDSDMPDEGVHRLERESLVRQALAAQTPECQKLIHLLFFSEPPVAYEDAAAQLGLAKGSMGATRMRCLEKLRRALEQRNFR